jgi:DNA-damage-inducible protein J
LFRLVIVSVAKGWSLFIKPLLPNAQTIEAMKAARRGELVTMGSTDELVASLNDGD